MGNEYKQGKWIMRMLAFAVWCVGCSDRDGHFKIPHLWPGQNPPVRITHFSRTRFTASEKRGPPAASNSFHGSKEQPNGKMSSSS